MEVLLRPRLGLALSALALACAAPGCGHERASYPGGRAEASEKPSPLRFPRVGMSLSLPSNAELSYRRPPGVFRGTLAGWIVSAFAYPRREQLPRDDAELQAARRRLVAEVRRRGRRYHLIRSRATSVAGARAVELLGDQTLSRNRLRTRSVHVYKGRAEYVLELLAPPREFRRANRTFLGMALRTLRVSGQVRPVRRKRQRER